MSNFKHTVESIETTITNRVAEAHKTLESKKKKYDEMEKKYGVVDGTIMSTKGDVYRERYEAEAIYNELVDLCVSLGFNPEKDSYFKNYYK